MKSPQRLIALDTETTGLNPEVDRVIAIGAVEIRDREVLISQPGLDLYLNPGEVTSSRASHAVHKLGQGFLQRHSSFAEVVDKLLDYVRGAKVLIHNADFDVGMLNSEIRRLLSRGKNYPLFSEVCEVVDTAKYASQRWRGSVSLDALARRFKVDNKAREYQHGALADSVLLARVYLAMTLQQSSLGLQSGSEPELKRTAKLEVSSKDYSRLRVTPPNAAESAAHERIMANLRKRS